MKNLQLTSEEKKELERRGFYVKKNFSISMLWKKIAIFSTTLSSLLFLELLSSGSIISAIFDLYILVWIFLTCYFTYDYLISYRTLWWDLDIIWFSKPRNKHESEDSFSEKILYLFILPVSKNWILGWSWLYLIWLLPIIYIIWWYFVWWSNILSFFGFTSPGFFISIFTALASLLLFAPLSIVLGYVIDWINPQYRYIDLSYKLQKRTEAVKEAWVQIIRILEEKNNDWVQYYFQKISENIAYIIGYLAKLEKKWWDIGKKHVFDSAKYIASFRRDVRKPLISLKRFLESKKTELQSSQQELSRVRVSVWWEWENRELQSIRSQELLKELDENIERLDEMLEKI